MSSVSTTQDSSAWQTVSSSHCDLHQDCHPQPISPSDSSRLASTPGRAHPDHVFNLDSYWDQRQKFVRHLEKRAIKFAKRSRQDYDAARWGNNNSKANRPQKGALSTPAPAQQPAPVAAVTPQTPAPFSREMFASTSSVRGVARVAAQASRPFSATARTLARAQAQDPNALGVTEASRLLKAIELTTPTSAFLFEIHLKAGKHARPPTIRGRVTLAKDPRRERDTILVFAEKNSLSAKLAVQEGADHVGADELFEPLINGEINPTKVLATPSMLGIVTSRLARFLGPKGMMPTTRRGGVGEGEELVQRIREAKGAFDWSSEQGVVTALIGRANFEASAIEANIRALSDSVIKALNVNSGTSIDEHLISRRQAKEKKAAGITKATLQSTHGPTIVLNDL